MKPSRLEAVAVDADKRRVGPQLTNAGPLVVGQPHDVRAVALERRVDVDQAEVRAVAVVGAARVRNVCGGKGRCSYITYYKSMTLTQFYSCTFH
jgi:hypothetical protein